MGTLLNFYEAQVSIREATRALARGCCKGTVAPWYSFRVLKGREKSQRVQRLIGSAGVRRWKECQKTTGSGPATPIR